MRWNMIVCPFCENEFFESEKKDGGWECRCGEFVPESMAVDTLKKCGCNRCK